MYVCMDVYAYITIYIYIYTYEHHETNSTVKAAFGPSPRLIGTRSCHHSWGPAPGFSDGVCWDGSGGKGLGFRA